MVHFLSVGSARCDHDLARLWPKLWMEEGFLSELGERRILRSPKAGGLSVTGEWLQGHARHGLQLRLRVSGYHPSALCLSFSP
jgi:hypothetical protein